jgi:hypothetical protein
LIHGIGSQGKSSVAARIANRMPGHDMVVIYGRYDASAVFDLEQILENTESGRGKYPGQDRVLCYPRPSIIAAFYDAETESRLLLTIC